MQKSIRQKKRHAGKKTPRQGKESREAQIARIKKWNRFVAKERQERLKDFSMWLKAAPPQGIEPAVRSVSIKFTQLPFGFIMTSGEGHIHSIHSAKELPVEIRKYVEPGKKVFFSPAYFEMVLNYSQGSLEFTQALKNAAEKHSFMKYVPISNMVTVSAKLSAPKGLPVKQQIQKIRSDNLSFIKEFEKIVDQFVEKYAVEAKT